MKLSKIRKIGAQQWNNNGHSKNETEENQKKLVSRPEIQEDLS